MVRIRRAYPIRRGLQRNTSMRINVGDVGMIKQRQHIRLALKNGYAFRIARERVAQYL